MITHVPRNIPERSMGFDGSQSQRYINNTRSIICQISRLLGVGLSVRASLSKTRCVCVCVCARNDPGNILEISTTSLSQGQLYGTRQFDVERLWPVGAGAPSGSQVLSLYLSVHKQTNVTERSLTLHTAAVGFRNETKTFNYYCSATRHNSHVHTRYI